MQVLNIFPVTKYISADEDGRLSSKYPHFFASVLLGILIEQPLFATP